MKRTRKHRPHTGRKRFGTKFDVDLWAARALGEDISRSAPKLTTERIELWNKFLPEDPTPFTYEETWNHICRNAQREDRGEQQRSLRHGPDSAILWTFEQLGALFLWQCRNPERFSNKPLFDYLCFRNSEYRRPRQKPVVKRGKDEALPRLLERDFAGIGPTLLAAITADHPFMGTAADLLELLKSVNGVVEEDGAGLHRKRDWTAEYIAEWLDDNWVKVEATFDAKRGIDSLDRTVFSIKPSRLIPFEKLREALSTFPEIALPMFSVMQDALARLFTLAYWGDRAASVAAKKTLEELLPRSNRHPITNHLPKIIEIFSRKRNGIVKSDAKIKQVHPGLTEAKRVKMLSVLYSEDPGTIRDAIRDQSEKAFLVQRLSKYLPVSETQVKRAVTATRCKSA